MLRLAFGCRFQLFRFLNHFYNFIKPVGAGNGLHLKDHFSLLHHGPRIDVAAGFLSYRHGLPCKGCLIHHGFSGKHGAVKGNYISHMDHDAVTRPDPARVHKNFLVVPYQPYLADMQGHASCQITYGFFVGPLLQQFPDSQQEHNRSRRIHVAPDHGDAHGRRIQNSHLQLSCRQAPDSPEQVFYVFQSCIEDSYRTGQEQLAAGPQQ